MAVKAPIVLYSGKLKELQAGDTISGATATVSIKQVNIDFGAGKSFVSVVVNDASLTDSSLVVASLAYDGSPAAIPNMIVACGTVNHNSFTLYLRTADGKTVTGSYRVNYISS